jgi:hypothetical protein
MSVYNDKKTTYELNSNIKVECGRINKRYMNLMLEGQLNAKIIADIIKLIENNKISKKVINKLISYAKSVSVSNLQEAIVDISVLTDFIDSNVRYEEFQTILDLLSRNKELSYVEIANEIRHYFESEKRKEFVKSLEQKSEEEKIRLEIEDVLCGIYIRDVDGTLVQRAVNGIFVEKDPKIILKEAISMLTFYERDAANKILNIVKDKNATIEVRFNDKKAEYSANDILNYINDYENYINDDEMGEYAFKLYSQSLNQDSFFAFITQKQNQMNRDICSVDFEELLTESQCKGYSEALKCGRTKQKQ